MNLMMIDMLFFEEVLIVVFVLYFDFDFLIFFLFGFLIHGCLNEDFVLSLHIEIFSLINLKIFQYLYYFD